LWEHIKKSEAFKMEVMNGADFNETAKKYGKKFVTPIQISKKNEDTYVFLTDNSIEYAVYFEKEILAYFIYNHLGVAEKFFEFGFISINIKLSEVNQYPYDERII